MFLYQSQVDSMPQSLRDKLNVHRATHPVTQEEAYREHVCKYTVDFDALYEEFEAKYGVIEDDDMCNDLFIAFIQDKLCGCISDFRLSVSNYMNYRKESEPNPIIVKGQPDTDILAEFVDAIRKSGFSGIKREDDDE